MVTTGFSDIHVAKYAEAGGVVTYSGCRKLARSKSMDIAITAMDANNFYADDVLAESETAAFKEGQAKVDVDGLDGDEEAFILGIEESTVQVGDKSVPVIKFGKNMNPPYLGLGAVKRMMLRGVESYRAVILCKTRFAVPAEAAETREEQTSWQTQELNATIMRDDTAETNWKIIPKTNFATKDEAIAFIKAILGGAA